MAEDGGDLSRNVLHNDGNTMVILNISPFTMGHISAVPVKHYTIFEDMDTETLNNLFKTV